MKPESTSKRVAKIAGKVMRIKAPLYKIACYDGIDGEEIWVTVKDLKALAASCLTQVADQKR